MSEAVGYADIGAVDLGGDGPQTYKDIYGRARELANSRNMSVYAFIGVNKTPTRAQLVQAIDRHYESAAERGMNTLAQTVTNILPENAENGFIARYPTLELSRVIFNNQVPAAAARDISANTFINRLSDFARRNQFSYMYVEFNLHFARWVPEFMKRDTINKSRKIVVDLRTMTPIANNNSGIELINIFSPRLTFDDGKLEPIDIKLTFRKPRDINEFPDWELGGSFANKEITNLNCVIKTIAKQLPDVKAEELLEDYKDLVHTDELTKYLTIDDIDKLGKARKYGFSFRVFTPIGLALNKPTITCGRNHGRVIDIAATDNHAYMVPVDHVNEISYLQDTNIITNEDIQGFIESNAPSIRNRPDLTGFITVNNKPCYGYRTTTEEVTTNGLFKKIKIHKYLRPSTITGDPSHDNDPRYYNCNTGPAVFAKWFISKSEFHNTPKHVRDVAKRAARPFRHYDAFTADNQTQTVIEIDHNASYASYELSPHYTGFPSGYYRTLGGPPSADNLHLVAFIECSNVIPKPQYTRIFDIFSKINPDMSAFTGVLYRFLRNYFDFTIVSTTYAEHTKASILGLLNDVKERITDLSEHDIATFIKGIRNPAIGRLVVGGLEESNNKIQIHTKSKQYADVLLDECAHNDLIHFYQETTDFNNNNIHVVTAALPGLANGKYIHVYGYINSLSKIAVLSKIIDDDLQPISIRIDGIKIADNPILPASSNNMGEFKCFRTKFTPVFINTTDVTFSTKEPPVSNPLPMIPRIVITGPPGTAKTHSIITTAPKSSLYLVHTKIMRAKQQMELMTARNIDQKTAKSHVMTVQTLTYRYQRLEAITAALNHAKQFGPRPMIKYQKKPGIYVDTHELTLIQLHALYKDYSRSTRDVYSHCTEVYFDEFAACLFSDLQVLTHVCNKNKLYLTLVGDYEQIENRLADSLRCRVQAARYNFEYSDNYACPETLTQMGFVTYHDPRTMRTPDNTKPHRHTYEYGNFLDTLRGKPISEQIEIAINSNRYKVVQEVPQNATLIAGTWVRIQAHINKLTNTHKLSELNLKHVRARNLQTSLVTTVSIDDPTLWKDKRKMADAPPANAKLICVEAVTVDSVQGETRTDDYCIDLQTMTRHGSFYTALTRAPTPENIYLLRI
jgi:hypothetical protein